jgi:hypothetical protein
MGGPVYRAEGSENPEFKPMGTDTVPAMLTPGEFVVKADAVTPQTLPLLQSINNNNGTRLAETEEQVKVPRLTNLSPSEMKSLDPSFRGSSSGYQIKGTSGLYLGDVTDPSILKKYPHLVNQDTGSITVQMMNKALEESAVGRRLPIEVMQAGIAARSGQFRSSTEQALHAMADSGIITKIDASRLSNDIHARYAALPASTMLSDGNNPFWKISDSFIKRGLSGNPDALSVWDDFSKDISVHTNTKRRSTTARSLSYTSPSGAKVKVGKLQGSGGDLLAHATTPKPLLNRIMSAGITSMMSRRVPMWGPKVRGLANGGMVYMADGGMVPGYEDGGRVMLADQMGLTPSAPGMPISKGFGSSYMSGLRNPYGKSIIPKMSGKPMGMGAQMGIGMAGMMAGQAVGGNAGTAIMMASNILPMMTAMKGFGKLIPSVAKVASILGRLTIPGAIIGTLVGIATLINKMKKDAATDALGFGLTAESASKAGLKFTDYNQKIKDSIESAKAMKERNQMLYESMTQSNTPLKMSIEQYKKLKEQIKETMPEYIKLIDRTKTDKVGDVAVQLKAQFIAAGDSAEEATAKIYALIEASNKKGSGFSAIASQQFRSVNTPQTAALTTADTFAKSMATTNEQAQVSSLLTAFQAIDTAVADSAKKNEEAVKKNKEQLVSIGTIIEDQINKINKG